MTNRHDAIKGDKTEAKKCFSSRELHYSVAFLIVVALLGGIVLQVFSSALTSRYGLKAPAVGAFLIIGYVALIILLPVFFTHRLIGPFKRLEYEMKLISGGDITKRLSIRSNDDLHVKNFIIYANEFIAGFDRMNEEHRRLSSLISSKMDDIALEISKERFDCERLKSEIRSLKAQLDELIK
jgi:signal transduction histidine kinase